MSRARHLLVVCGDLDRIRAVAGKQVAKQPRPRDSVTRPV